MLLITINGCNVKNDDLNRSIEQLAELECRAINLREQRFSLSSQMRMIEDSIRLKATLTQNQIHKNTIEFQLQKDSLLKNSLALADSIKAIMEDVLAKKLTTDKSKAEFNQKLNNALKLKGCLVIQ